MKILAAIICCDYKSYSLQKCIDHVKAAGFDVLLNYEGHNIEVENVDYLQRWVGYGSGFNSRKFDQDQNARLTPICIARNMCMDFFQQTDYDYLLFVDSDVMIFADTRDKLFSHKRENNVVLSGLVGGRGIHKSAQYLFGKIADLGPNLVSVEYATCGFLAIPRDLAFRTRFRWGLPTNGGVICSEDPIFGDDLRTIHNGQWLVITDCIAQHEGDLKQGETSQF